MIAADPETLTSSMQLTAAMLINVIGRLGSNVPAREPGSAFSNVRSLLFDNHENLTRQRALARRAIGIYRTLRAGGVVQQTGGGFDGSASIRLTLELQPNFALNQPLSPFALAAFELLDRDSAGYALDMISVLEATLDDPRAILSQQQFRARGEAVAVMKAEGIEYDQRMELLEDVTWPKPLEELLSITFETFASSQPWVRDFELSPKSVVRELYERAMTFGEFVAFYQLGRSEGLVLRYLSDAFRAARQTIPDDAKTEELRDLIEWLGELVRQVDSSLLDEWEAAARSWCWCATSCGGACSWHPCSATKSSWVWIRMLAGRRRSTPISRSTMPSAPDPMRGLLLGSSSPKGRNPGWCARSSKIRLAITTGEFAPRSTWWPRPSRASR
jgi:hypothetical protein